MKQIFIILSILFNSHLLIAQQYLDIKDYENLAQNRIDAHLYKEAAAYFDTLILLAPEKAFYYEMKAKAHYFEGNNKKGIETLKSGIEKRPKVAELHGLLSSLYSIENLEQEALESILTALNLDHDNTHYLRSAAGYNFKLGHYEIALKLQNELAQEDPNNPDILNMLGLYNKTLGNKEKANEIYAKAISLLKESRKKDQQILLSSLLFDIGQKKQAFNNINKIIQSDSLNWYAIAFRAGLYLEKGHYEKASKDFRKAIELDNEDDISIVYNAYALIQLEQNQEALTDLDQLIIRYPKMAHAYAFRGLLYLKQNKYALAKRDLETCIALRPKHPIGYRWRGELNILTGDIDQGCKDLNYAKERYFHNLYIIDAPNFEKLIQDNCSNK